MSVAGFDQGRKKRQPVRPSLCLPAFMISRFHDVPELHPGSEGQHFKKKMKKELAVNSAVKLVVNQVGFYSHHSTDISFSLTLADLNLAQRSEPIKKKI